LTACISINTNCGQEPESGTKIYATGTVIAQSDITVTYPNGGEELLIGNNYEITWSQENVENVKLEYSTDNGSSWTEIIASTDASAGSYEWTVPSAASTNCKVSITDITDASITDQSDGVFSIKPEIFSLSGTLHHRQIAMSIFENVEPSFWLRDEETGSVYNDFIASYNSNDGTYTLDNLPAYVGIQVYFNVTETPRFLPGDYYSWETVNIPELTEPQRNNYDIELQKIIHLLEPHDNSQIDQTINEYPSYEPSMTISWEHIEGTAYYSLRIDKYRDFDHPEGFGLIENVLIENNYTDTTLATSLDLSEPYEHYQLYLYARADDGRMIGMYMISYIGGLGWDFRFKVQEATPELPFETTITSSGGTINSAIYPELVDLGLDGFILEIPDNALNEDIDVSIDIVYDIPPSSASLVHSPVSLTVQGHEEGYDFLSPVTVSIPYPDTAELEDGFTVLTWNENDQDWVSIDMPETIQIDTVNNIITFQTIHFSVYAIVESGTVYLLNSLIETINGYDNINGGLKNSLTKKLENVIAKLEKGNKNAAANQLGAFINQVEAKRGKKKGLTNEQADELMAQAQSIIAMIIGQAGAAKPAIFQETILPQEYSLSQNTPNPFNPVTTIVYSIPDGTSAHVSLNVYDLRGALVRTLVDQTISHGVHSVVWDGTDENGNRVSSGMYIYRLQTGNFTKSQKMMLVR
ncbi:FlgD immunoglobulin-like domain containing protein, partial [Candidatus Latescibacterota bacterium]